MGDLKVTYSFRVPTEYKTAMVKAAKALDQTPSKLLMIILRDWLIRNRYLDEM